MASRHEEIKARLLATFAVEAQEHLQALTAHLLALDRGLPPDEAREVVEATFREMHTLKGAARAVSLMDVEALCQEMENVLHRITRGDLGLNHSILERLQEGMDGVARMLAGEETRGVRELIDRLEQATAALAGAASAPVAASAPPAAAPGGPLSPGLAPADTIRFSTATLEALLLQAEELLVPKLASAERTQEARALVEALTGCHTTTQRLRASLKAASPTGQATDLLAGLDAALREVEAQARALLTHLVHDERTVSGTVESVLGNLRWLRMTPASAVLDLFPRMVNDLANEQGKEVEWVARGTELEVDRKVFEAMKDPLIHLVRNAIGHGIESPQARIQAGKAPRGRVMVSVAPLEGGRLELCVEEDGRGIDLVQVRTEAVRSRVLSAEAAAALTDDVALDLVYRSGLSTSPIITNVSGRGLGLAIVKERVEGLGGEIHLGTRAGAGTTVRMLLPATIATFHGLLVQAGGQLFLVPTEAVERVIRIARDDVEPIEGRDLIRYNGHPLAVARLSALLGLPEPTDGPDLGRKEWGVVLRVGEERAACIVTAVLGGREGLVKELRPPLVRVRNVASAGLLGTNQVVLILRPSDLLRSMRVNPHPLAPPTPREAERRQPVILVVDDSITTRTMEKNLLELAGYEVQVAVDGVEAWTTLKSVAVDLVLSDVDMPRMDGFELTARIRADVQLINLPVVLVTALASREDQERGVEVGANAYIVKASFDQSNLLEVIRRLV
jgi:two-component system chemotaxis sensor kinase CheA